MRRLRSLRTVFKWLLALVVIAGALWGAYLVNERSRERLAEEAGSPEPPKRAASMAG